MHISESTLIEGALRRSKLILVSGMVSSAADVRAMLAALYGEVVELDLRSTDEDPGRPIDLTGEDPRPAGRAVGVPTPRDTASPIAAIEAELADPRHRTLLLHIEPSPGPGALRVLSALAGRPLDGNAKISIPEETRVVVFAGSGAAAEAAASLFAMRISGMNALQELREQAARAEALLREAQAYARESSRLHGIR